MLGYSAERRLERQLIADYERVLDEVAQRLSPRTHSIAVALAALPEDIKGFGHVKLASCEIAKKREAALLQQLRDPQTASVKIAAE
jgi:indolepyruvate ferredoxin oxidoreductase